MNLNKFSGAEYFHEVSMDAELEDEISEVFYQIMCEIDDAAKNAQFDLMYPFDHNCSNNQILYLRKLLESLNFKVGVLYKVGDIDDVISGLQISW